MRDTPFRIGQPSDECNIVCARDGIERTSVTFECAEGTFDFPLDRELEADKWAKEQKISQGTISTATWTLDNGQTLTFERSRGMKHGRLCFRIVRIMFAKEGDDA